MKKKFVAVALGATALSTVAPAYAMAQVAQRISSAERYDIPAGGLLEALQTWSKVTKLQIIYRMEDVAGKQTSGVRGDYPPMLALQGLLLGTGLKIVTTEGGAVALRPLSGDEVEDSATPDILVTNRLNWSLNTGIERTQDDSQPFIVMGRKEIERSGAPNLESFLRNQLNVNTSPIVGDQAVAGIRTADRPVGISNINLRGIGSRDTLILIDGRRQPGINLGTGDISQPSITGIPIAAVERIEVLASSASGIYGSGASGGVINIVLRRDFKGGELSFNYDNTTDFAQARKTLDLVAGVPLEGGRTRLSITGNWTKSDPLLYGDRENLRQRGLPALLANSPDDFYGAYLYPPQGAMTNFKSASGQPLTPKPAYGGQTLSTSFGTIPGGYTGVQSGGIAPLLASLGTYNLDQSNTAYGSGARAPLIYGLDQYSGSIGLRREFNRWLTGYTEFGLTHSSGVNVTGNTVTSYTLAANAPNNPFTQSLYVTLPGDPRADVAVRSTTSTMRALGGAIIRLPANWQAVAELAYSKSTYKVQNAPAAVSSESTALLQSGVINGLQDVSANPLALAYDDTLYYTRRQNSDAWTLTPSLRVAGPLPFSLPGGKPQMTVNTEINTQRVGAVLTTTLTPVAPLTNYTPAATQTTRSVYAEVVFPLLGGKHTLPLIELLELRVSARHESYKGDGADPYACYQTFVPGQVDYFTGCPEQGAVINRSISRNSHTDPSISMRWQPIGGITFRGSYTTGYLPPKLSQLVRLPTQTITIEMGDSARGGELIGDQTFGIGIIPGFVGGNPNLKPETSKTLTAGVILQPHFIDGLRFSVDWTRLRKRDLYFDPSTLVASFFGGSQAQFDQFLKEYPNRVIRGPASDGYAVGPITSLDVSLVNLKSLETQAFDFTLNYDTLLFGGNLSAVGRATYTDSLTIQAFGDSPAVNYAGVVTRSFAAAGGSSGALRWRGSGSVQWTKGAVSFGWQTRYMSSYYLMTDHSVVPQQGSAKVGSQMYHDINFTYKLPIRATLRAGVNNLFNTLPPLDASQSPLYYSAYGDPRLRSFYLGISKSF